MSGPFQILCEALPLATVVMLFALQLSRRRQLPATRGHQLLMAACLLSLLSPLLVGLMPKWQVLPAVPTTFSTGLPTASHGSAPSYPLWFRALGWLWAAGLLAGLAHLGRQLAQCRALWRESTPAPRELEALLGRLAARRGIARPLQLRLHPTLESACTWGVRRPVILIPRDEAGLSFSELRMMLDHELAHIQRFDAASGWLLQTFAACFWFHPCARLLARRADLLKERACDDLVLLSGQHPAAYAACLGSTALRATPARRLPRAACTFARRHPLLARLDAILDSRQARSQPSPEETFRAITPITLLAVLLSALGFKVAAEVQPLSPAWIASAPGRPVPSLWSDVIEPAAATAAAFVGYPVADLPQEVAAAPRRSPATPEPPRAAPPRRDLQRPTSIAGLGKALRSVPSRPASAGPSLSTRNPRLQVAPPALPRGDSRVSVGAPPLPPASEPETGDVVVGAVDELDWIQLVDDRGIEVQVAAPAFLPDGEPFAVGATGVESTRLFLIGSTGSNADASLAGISGVTAWTSPPELLPVQSEDGAHFAISVEVPALGATAWSAEASTDAVNWTDSVDIVEQSIAPGTSGDTVRVEAAVIEPARSSRYRYLRLKADW